MTNPFDLTDLDGSEQADINRRRDPTDLNKIPAPEKNINPKKCKTEFSPQTAREFSGDNSAQIFDAGEIQKPKIRCNAGEIAAATEQAFNILANEKNPFEAVYVRGQILVRITRYKKNGKSRKDGIERAEGSTLLTPICADWLTYHFSQRAEWYAIRKLPKKDGGETEIPKEVPDRVARFIMASAPWEGLPILNGVINAPTILLDGRVIQTPGFDEETGLLFDPDGTTFPKIPERPSKAEAEAALEVLKKPFAEFPFKSDDGDEAMDEAYRSVALSAAITGLVRKCISISPQFAIDATAPSSGKTLLASCPSLIATGLDPMLVAPNPDPEAEKKALFAALLDGPNSILVDNIEGEYGSSTLNAILTTEEYTDRLLGFSKQARVPTNSLFLCTGNNLVIKGDLGARTLICRIDAEVEDPDTRTFELKENLKRWISQNRGQLAVAAITIIKAYIAAGSPTQDVPNYGRFDEWQKLCRLPLIWLGCADPCKTRDKIRKSNPEIKDLETLLKAWFDRYHEEERTVSKIIEDCERPSATEEEKALLEALRSVGQRGPTISTRAVGKFLSKSAGRIIDSRRLIRCGTEHQAQKWAVEEVRK